MMYSRFIKFGVFVAAVAMMSVSCGEQEETQEVKERSISVRAQIVLASNETVSKTYTGSLEGEQQAVLVARIGEAVTAVNFQEGDRVKAGQVIISLDHEGASSRYVEARSIFLNSEKTYKKMEFLFREGAVSESQYDEARTASEVARASFDAATRLVEIESPIDGVVTSFDVAAGDFPHIGQRLAMVATTGRLRIRFPVNASDIGYFHRGAEVMVSTDRNDRTTTGKIAAVSQSADPVTRSFEVEVLIDNSDDRLQVGTFATVEMVVERLDNVFAIPRSAVMNLADQDIVYVVSNGRAEKRPVTLGMAVAELVTVIDGLKSSDTLVTLGQSYLDDGTKVNISAFDREVR